MALNDLNALKALKILTRADLALCDARDPLALFRHRFTLPPGLVYLVGNSLGAMPSAAAAQVDKVVRNQWGEMLVSAWNAAGWFDLPQRVGAKIARLVGAGAHEVVATDSTSVNLFKVLAAALSINASRRTIVSELDNFPTDLYVAQGLLGLTRGGTLQCAKSPEDLVAQINTDTAVVMLTHVNYRTGAMHDMAELTRIAHARGALVIWDLSHSTGAVPVALGASQVDFAVGCGYKYLNGGPGAPAFVYVAERHHDQFTQPLSGWHGHAEPFRFDPDYRPATGVARYLCGTPPILSMAGLECGIDLMLEASMADLRAKSIALSETFIELIEQRCAGYGLTLLSPRDPSCRGSQVSLTHPNGYQIMQALIAARVMGDFRAPDVLRFGFAPLYVRHVDVWDAVEVLRDILESKRWQHSEFQIRRKVT